MKKGVLFLLILSFGFIVYGQDASKVTEILEAEKFTRAQASYIAASWLDPANESLDFAGAAEIVVGQGFLDDGLNMNEPIRLDELAGLCMKAWNVPGGLFYRMTKARRYAYKELVARQFLPSNSDPSFNLSGAEGLNVMYRCMELKNPILFEE